MKETPAEIREDINLEQAAVSIRAELENGDLVGQKSLEHYRRAGELLSKAKLKVGHGNWLDWLTKANIDQQRASECMRIAGQWAKLPTVGSFREAMRVLTEESDEPATQPEVTSNRGGSVYTMFREEKDPPKPKIHCSHCERLVRVGQEPRKNCPDCKKARKVEKKKVKKERARQLTEMVDCFKNPVPKGCKDVWADPWLPKTFDFLVVITTKYRELHLADGLKKRAAHYPWIESKEIIDGLIYIDNYLDQIIEHLKAKRPAGVCPKCQGQKCQDCRMSGLVPRDVYEKLSGAAK